MSSIRYAALQHDRTLHHPKLPQNDPIEKGDDILPAEMKRSRPKHSFVVCADTQFGMTTFNRGWEAELSYSRQAIKMINELEPRPLFCCACGDLVDMERSFWEGKGFTGEECESIQGEQRRDFKEMWESLHEDIALVCLCGNHDIGNRPTKTSIGHFVSAFGDDYLSFWANGTFNIVLNTTLFSDPSGAEDLYEAQLTWLERRLEYASSQGAEQIFVFGHHPWFLYKDDEGTEDLHGASPIPPEWVGMELRGTKRPNGFPDSYFHIPIENRGKALDLFKRYNVQAAFAGHFHQNLIAKASFGMEMIVTSSLSVVLESTAKKNDLNEPTARGFRLVEVEGPSFSHQFIPLPSIKGEDANELSSD